MSTSRVQVFGVIGQTAIDLQNRLETLLIENQLGEEEAYAPNAQLVDDLADRLASICYQLPIVYFSEYVDDWSVADSQFHLLSEVGSGDRICRGQCCSMVYFPRADSESLLGEIRSLKTESFYKNQCCDRWFLQHTEEAIGRCFSYEHHLIVAVSRFLEPSRYDDLIRPWLNQSAMIF